jgi:hypothetical protein
VLWRSIYSAWFFHNFNYTFKKLFVKSKLKLFSKIRDQAGFQPARLSLCGQPSP